MKRADVQEALGRELNERADDLRREFDQTFARPPSAEPAAMEDLLRVKVGADPYALRMAEVSGLVRCRRIIPLPTAVGGFLGVVGLRSGIVPVYALRELLGYAAGEPPGWLVLVGEDNALGLAFDGFEGHLRVPGASLSPADEAGRSRPHLLSVARDGRGVLSVLSVESLVQAIERQVQPASQRSHQL